MRLVKTDWTVLIRRVQDPQAVDLESEREEMFVFLSIFDTGELNTRERVKGNLEAGKNLTSQFNSWNKLNQKS